MGEITDAGLERATKAPATTVNDLPSRAGLYMGTHARSTHYGIR